MSSPTEFADWEWDILMGLDREGDELFFNSLFSEDTAGRKYLNVTPNYRVEEDYTYATTGLNLDDSQRITTWRIMRVSGFGQAWEMDCFYSQADAVEVARYISQRKSSKI